MSKQGFKERIKMERHTFALEVISGKRAEFRKALGEVWSELTVFLDAKGMKNFGIWNVENIVFGYYETEVEFTFNEQDKMLVSEWEKRYSNAYCWISIPFQNWEKKMLEIMSWLTNDVDWITGECHSGIHRLAYHY